MGFFDKIKQGLTKTKTKMDAQLTGIFAAYAPGDEEFFEDLEETLILADTGVETTTKAIAQLRKAIELKKLTTGAEVKKEFVQILTRILKVQPPGKALSTLSLMSGGEMAFVAIALYFAILKVRPTPFCVMDEIEAALDEANVTRYVQYMRRLAKNTQFLVITHRRGTMEEADHLFGVTMQEKGVSSVIELSLDEAAKTIS